MVVLCKQNVWLLVAVERFNTITNSPCVGVGSSPAGRRARRKKRMTTTIDLISHACSTQTCTVSYLEQESDPTYHKPPKVYTENLVNDTYVGSSTVLPLSVSSRRSAAAILISSPLPIPLAKDQECAMP
ncbi:hypothetical protein K443DRAFT_481972 [Laccaria amethystina LaAM-08-1]|uniref:Unplaced genomic scaffold K443scaffold_461, whole genome shotgun sequence n=1 Tax=Laccaria amethystina LaAM-08-1 TaxID=1095629 RepID=A0A0C9X1N9_9AGAR|nr:hypothetical protein K443DRAFT_481972 [Laccaria amethystina LaAM-08-1]